MMDITVLLLLKKPYNVPSIQLACTYPLLILGFRVTLANYVGFPEELCVISYNV